MVRSRALKILVVLVVLVAAWALTRRYALHPAPPPPDAARLEHVRRGRIVRDTSGVPHIFGERDQDAAFGLAYAHAEDDYPTIQAMLAASRGQLGVLVLGKLALASDSLRARGKRLISYSSRSASPFVAQLRTAHSSRGPRPRV
jgi:acyl-homoserine lactone acylase PvdQ